MAVSGCIAYRGGHRFGRGGGSGGFGRCFGAGRGADTGLSCGSGSGGSGGDLCCCCCGANAGSGSGGSGGDLCCCCCGANAESPHFGDGSEREESSGGGVGFDEIVSGWMVGRLCDRMTFMRWSGGLGMSSAVSCLPDPRARNDMSAAESARRRAGFMLVCFFILARMTSNSLADSNGGLELALIGAETMRAGKTCLSLSGFGALGRSASGLSGLGWTPDRFTMLQIQLAATPIEAL